MLSYVVFSQAIDGATTPCVVSTKSDLHHMGQGDYQYDTAWLIETRKQERDTLLFNDYCCAVLWQPKARNKNIILRKVPALLSCHTKNEFSTYSYYPPPNTACLQTGTHPVQPLVKQRRQQKYSRLPAHLPAEKAYLYCTKKRLCLQKINVSWV